ncbi:MAG TPA: ABC transporter substrate-binding protein [Bosea sp. (in: a-proteobacteria)]|jgi:putative spermidine/putrescine transport system substrate-binding protein|uniref:ABC transporter substrate-binding protein n=1 Tax=Bosea sp. (in: a-proteobacteria) TaxID=1871050 RepID=UPI002E157605|nr:ABC transporter substrate-binding protein [Bosea sp. (in: a-proteobacteria)]
MMEKQSFAEDCRALAAELGGGQTRRDLIRSALALGIAPAALALGGGAARAQAGKEVVLVNFGGVAMKAFDEAYVKPFAAQGGKIVLDGSGALNGKILTMVQSRHVTWDICDAGITTLAELGPHGALEKIDYSIVDKTKLDPTFAYDEGVVNYMFSSVLAWDKSKISGEPTLADFFDTKKYPGRRMMRKDSQAMLEFALLADGVPKDKLYPLDVKRAFAKIATIKKDLLFWNSGSESQSLMRDGECVMGLLWHTRANVLADETQGRVTYTFKDGLLQPGLWVVPKGNPAGKEAMRAIASMQQPEGQVKLLAAMGNGPSNPAADALVPAELKKKNPSDAANAAVQAKINADWYKANHSKTFQSFLDLISS